ncbi:lysine--tRNA ligase [Nanoarchaeota archaeon]
MKEKFFWADAIADQIIKKNPKKKQYVCAAGTGLSGRVHIGNFRDVITAELVVRALKDKGKNVKFIYSWDDYDRFRKVPVGIDEKYEKYLGMPVSEFPSPFSKTKNYARYFEEEFEKSLKKVGVKSKFIYQHKMHKANKYKKLIKIAIDKRGAIMKILNKYRKDLLDKDWWPITVYCEKCKKDFTKILDVKEYVVGYSCKCGYIGKIDFRKKPGVKLKWRVDWPARWFYEKVDFEPGGIDLSVYGGSFMTGKEIAKEIFDYEAPMYVFYDWIKIKGGEEFSGSSGNVLTINDVADIYEPEILRYLFVGTKPKTGFQISFDNDVIKIYEDYDSLEQNYYEGKANHQKKRIYELSQVNKVPKKKPEKISFRHLVTLVQTGKIKTLKGDDKKRAEKVENWLEKYAGEDMKFSIQEVIPKKLKLGAKQKIALIELRGALESKKWKEEDLFNEFYEICKKTGLENTEFFQIAYNIIIDKNKGPRLATLILAIGQDKIIKLLDQVR